MCPHPVGALQGGEYRLRQPFGIQVGLGAADVAALSFEPRVKQFAVTQGMPQGNQVAAFPSRHDGLGIGLGPARPGGVIADRYLFELQALRKAPADVRCLQCPMRCHSRAVAASAQVKVAHAQALQSRVGLSRGRIAGQDIATARLVILSDISLPMPWDYVLVYSNATARRKSLLALIAHLTASPDPLCTNIPRGKP